MRRFLACLLLVASVPGLAQTPQHKENTALFARRLDWGIYSPKMFPDMDRKVIFALATSWIPGEKHEGMFRYILTASPEKLSLAQRAQASVDPDSPDLVKKLITRVHDCVITLDLYDTDGFVLRKIDVPFSFGVDDNANITSLSANDAVQMDLADYKNFAGSGGKSGSWDVSWFCDPLGGTK